MVDRENISEVFPADAYVVSGYRGIAWYVIGWETEPDEDTEWTGQYQRTGKVIARMVGDDRDFALEPDSLCPLNAEDYCGICGQIGCCHDGMDR